MNQFEVFKSLAAAASRDGPPVIDVTDRVMARISPQRRRAVDMPLIVFSGLSVLAASIAAIVAVQAWSILSDPLAGLFQPLTLVMQ